MDHPADTQCWRITSLVPSTMVSRGQKVDAGSRSWPLGCVAGLGSVIVSQAQEWVGVVAVGRWSALLRLVSRRHAELATAGCRQITNTSSSNATATRRVTGASTASS